jgi:hypothetical protein
MILDTNSKSMERFIPKAKQVPKKRETSLHLMPDSSFYGGFEILGILLCKKLLDYIIIGNYIFLNLFLGMLNDWSNGSFIIDGFQVS